MARNTQRWTTVKPPYGVPVILDRSDPSSRGLIYCTLANTPGRMVDLVGSLDLPWVSTLGTYTPTLLAATRSGVGTLTDGTGEGAKVTTPASHKLQTGTVIWRGVILGAGDAYCPLIAVSYASTDISPYVSFGLHRDGGLNLQGLWNNGTVQVLQPGGGITYGATGEYALTFTAGAVNLYVNGVLLGTSATAGTISYHATSALGIGNYANSNRNSNQITDCAWIFDRVLSAAELLQHSRTPYVGLRSPDPVRRSQPSATGYTLAAAAGAFVLSGQAAALKTGRRLSAAAGSFGLSGQAASLKAGRLLSSGAGAFVESGQAAALRAGRRLTSAVGTFAVSGQAATLTVGHRLSAAAGAFTLSGQAAALKQAHKLTAGAGAFSLSGQPATLTYAAGRTLTATTGAFTVSGQAAALRVGHRLTGSVGAVALTGTAAVLRVGHRLASSTGAFSFTGRPAAMTYTAASGIPSGALLAVSDGLVTAIGVTDGPVTGMSIFDAARVQLDVADALEGG